METQVIKAHPELKEAEVRFKKTVDSLVASFQIEGIEFAPDELDAMVQKMKDELNVNG